MRIYKVLLIGLGIGLASASAVAHQAKVTAPSPSSFPSPPKDASREGLRLSGLAQSRFGIRLTQSSKGAEIELPSTALLLSGEETSVYVFRRDMFFRLPAIVKRRQGKTMWIQANGISPQDQIVIEGVGFLRIVELAAEDQDEEGDGHGHVGH